MNTDQKEMRLYEKSIKLFSKPSLVFSELKEKPDWWFPLMVITIITIISVLSTTDLQIQAQRDFINNSEIIPEGQKTDMLDELDKQGVVNSKIVPAIGGAVSVCLSSVIIAGGLIFFGNFIYGGQTAFKQIFSLVCWVGLINLPELVIKVPFMVIKGTLQIPSSPAIFMISGESKSLLYNVLDVFDVFAIWKIILFATGFAIIYNFNMKKSYIAIIILYLTYSGISIGLGQLFKGFMV